MAFVIHSNESQGFVNFAQSLCVGCNKQLGFNQLLETDNENHQRGWHKGCYDQIEEAQTWTGVIKLNIADSRELFRQGLTNFAEGKVKAIEKEAKRVAHLGYLVIGRE